MSDLTKVFQAILAKCSNRPTSKEGEAACRLIREIEEIARVASDAADRAWVIPPIEKVVSAAEALLRVRNKNGATASEADFLAGAMSVLQEVYATDPSKFAPGIPPMWTIAPMSGRPMFADCPAPAQSEFIIGVVYKGPFETEAEADEDLEEKFPTRGGESVIQIVRGSLL